MKHIKQVAAVDEQAQRVQENQSELDRLTQEAGATFAEVQEFSADVAKMSDRMAILAAESARALGVVPETLATRNEWVNYARKCDGDIIASARNFDNGLPEVQRLFQDLADALATVRQLAASVSRQQSLQAVFARQAAQSFQICTGRQLVVEPAEAVALGALSVAATSLTRLSPSTHSSHR